jgi:hypothetical protein
LILVNQTLAGNQRIVFRSTFYRVHRVFGFLPVARGADKRHEPFCPVVHIRISQVAEISQ